MNQIIKKNSSTFFGEACQNCAQRNICLSPTKVLAEKRQFILRILGYRQKPNKYMTAGIEAHRKLQEGKKDLIGVPHPSGGRTPKFTGGATRRL